MNLGVRGRSRWCRLFPQAWSLSLLQVIQREAWEENLEKRFLWKFCYKPPKSRSKSTFWKWNEAWQRLSFKSKLVKKEIMFLNSESICQKMIWKFGNSDAGGKFLQMTNERPCSLISSPLHVHPLFVFMFFVCFFLFVFNVSLSLLLDDMWASMLLDFLYSARPSLFFYEVFCLFLFVYL